MTAFQHAVLWIDHRQARLFRLMPERVEKLKVHADHHHFHREQDSLGSRRERGRIFFAAVSDALGACPEVLLLGPGNARAEFLSYLKEHRPAQLPHILGNQACDDEGDEALVEKGRRFFRAADRMLPAG
jgi:hypothetical protein